MTTTSSRMQGDVLLVGSMPFDTVQEALRSCATVLDGHVSCLPDGEVDDRRTWIGFLPLHVFSGHPELEELSRPESGRLQQPTRTGSDARTETPWLFRVRPGADLRFDDLGYGRLAVESYTVFARLRETGVIPEGVRFQVCIPGPDSAIDSFFSDAAQWPQVRRAYVEGIRHELGLMLQAIPAEDLVIQFDFCIEVVDLAVGGQRFLPFWPHLTIEQKFARHTAPLDQLTCDIPAETLVGLHWCYGTWGGWPMTAMEDLTLCVELSNHAVRRIARPLDYVHMPVVRHPTEPFFAPLDDLDVGDTRVYLGLVHHTDGVDGFRERLRLARRHLEGFGIASVCGYGRVAPEALPEILRVHHDCAEAL